MKKPIFIVLAALGALVLTGCAKNVDVSKCVSEGPGFWHGLWHGLIFYVSWVVSLFNDDVAVYAVNNSGGWYDFGFMLGVSSITSGTSSIVSKKKS